MSYRLARSLITLINQVNAAWPGRDKKSDGWIGDARHATSKSDHNPWVKDPKGVGVVTAVDIDEDLAADVHSLKAMVDSICASKDPRVKYIIYEGRITVKGSQLQAWKKYTGKNSHSHHAHISVESKQSLYDNTDEWSISGSLQAEPDPVSDGKQFYRVVKRDTLSGLARKFATSVDELKRLNQLDSDLIVIGQELRVK